MRLGLITHSMPTQDKGVKNREVAETAKQVLQSCKYSDTSKLAAGR
jgi:hypothetical protein